MASCGNSELKGAAEQFVDLTMKLPELHLSAWEQWVQWAVDKHRTVEDAFIYCARSGMLLAKATQPSRTGQNVDDEQAPPLSHSLASMCPRLATVGALLELNRARYQQRKRTGMTIPLWVVKRILRYISPTHQEVSQTINSWPRDNTEELYEMKRDKKMVSFVNKVTLQRQRHVPLLWGWDASNISTRSEMFRFASTRYITVTGMNLPQSGKVIAGAASRNDSIAAGYTDTLVILCRTQNNKNTILPIARMVDPVVEMVTAIASCGW